MSAGRALLLIFGSGFGGSYIYANREYYGGLVNNVTRATVHELSRPRGSSGGGGGGSGAGNDEYRSMISELTEQVNRLTAQVAGGKNAAAQQPAVMVIHGEGSKGNAFIMAKTVIPLMLIVLGATSLILRSKGVTKSRFSKSMEGMQNGIMAVSSTLRNVKEDLIERIWKVEERMQTTNREIRSKIESAVGEARRSVDEVGQQVEKLQDVLKGMDNQFESVDDSMQFAVRGVYMLCSYVAEIGHLSGKARSDLSRFLTAADAPDQLTDVERSSSLPSLPSNVES